MSPEQEAARQAEFIAFVTKVRTLHAERWPATGREPWPDCWDQHPGLVANLWVLKRWYDQLRTGAVEGDVFLAAQHWDRYLENPIATTIATISRGLCKHRHTDPAAPRSWPERPIRTPPPLPGTVVPTPPPANPLDLADPWPAFFEHGTNMVKRTTAWGLDR